jgi:lysine 2,3-aminomutase
MIDAGIPMVSQSVLLRGVNDDVETLEALMRAFVEARIKPYYLHHADLAPGTSHFRTTIAEGQALMRALRGRVSGLAQPTYVLDIPGGFGKVPVGPSYLDMCAEAGAVVEDINGVTRTYP